MGIGIDADFPGGNIVVEGITGDRVSMAPDLRDTEGFWFYWNMRLRGAAGRTLEFTFTHDECVGALGPAVSLDGWNTWNWLGTDSITDRAFRFSVPEGAGDVRLGFGPSYTAATLASYLARHAANPNLAVDTLAKSRKGRNVPLLRAGRLDGRAEYRMFLTARHHACEMMANYEMEGFLDAVLDGSGDGKWYRANAEVLAVPFVDADGVEDGDQGKNRLPHDHGRDYEKGIYPETSAIRALLPDWSAGRPLFTMDMHCPYAKGPSEELIFFVGIDDAGDWEEVGRFARLLESLRTGGLPFSASDNLPFGKDWNTNRAGAGGLRGFHSWSSRLPGIRLASSGEFAYARVKGEPTSSGGTRAFGRDLARATRAYMTGGK